MFCGDGNKMLDDVLNKIERQVAEKDLPMPKLIAVSKKQPNERVRAVLSAGHRVFGENRVQEAEEKWPIFAKEFDGIELHLLGPLQSNKVKKAVQLFDVIHSIDSVKLIEKIAYQREQLQKNIQLFIQVNIGEENQKSGAMETDLPNLVKHARDLNLNVIGLMCIPPSEEDPRPYFRKLKKLNLEFGFSELSMGMSGDYLQAIDEGATHVRVGSAIFGERLYG